ncbi:YaeQ family protein [Nocardia sp. NPDC005978]|uniref:YaeQ family protein n=1 Tax=unclassified Nocardia TaxID=2637762 RepID=UPI0033BAFD44
MALSATLHNFSVQLADIDRGVYEDLELRLARHPSENDEFMLTRLLAYCLEYEEGIAFSDGGVSATKEPAVLVRDLTGRVTAWIEIGSPDADRVHRGSKLADRTAVYTHHDPAKVLAQLSGKKIHRARDITLVNFEPDFIEKAVEAIQRRNAVSISITEGDLYLDLNGSSFKTVIEKRTLS